jgi:hypothetical protein
MDAHDLYDGLIYDGGGNWPDRQLGDDGVFGWHSGDVAHISEGMSPQGAKRPPPSTPVLSRSSHQLTLSVFTTSNSPAIQRSRGKTAAGKASPDSPESRRFDNQRRAYGIFTSSFFVD